MNKALAAAVGTTALAAPMLVMAPAQAVAGPDFDSFDVRYANCAAKFSIVVARGGFRSHGIPMRFIVKRDKRRGPDGWCVQMRSTNPDRIVDGYVTLYKSERKNSTASIALTGTEYRRASISFEGYPNGRPGKISVQALDSEDDVFRTGYEGPARR